MTIFDDIAAVEQSASALQATITDLSAARALDVTRIAELEAEVARLQAEVEVPPLPSIRERVGVTTHFAYTDSAKRKCAYFPPTSTDPGTGPFLRGLIQDLGVWHLRDGCGWGRDALIAWMVGLHNDLDVMFTMTMDPRDGADIPRRLNAYRPLARAGALATLEGKNEPGGREPTATDNTATRTWEKQWIDAALADVDFRDIPMAAPSLADTLDTSDYLDLGAIANLDLGNSHPYPGNSVFVPGTRMLRSWTDIDNGLSAIAAKGIANARIVAGAGNPVIATEANMTVGGNSDQTATEQQQADLLPRIATRYLAAGYERVFFYELVASRSTAENSHEEGFGLVRYDGTKRPAFGALKALLAS
jgi:hypothetical protein